MNKEEKREKDLLNREKPKFELEGGKNDIGISKDKLKSQQKEIELRGLIEFYNLRGWWSWCIIIWISLLLLFSASLTIGIGCGWLDFSDYKDFLLAVTVEVVIQILGLGIIIVKFLYPHK